MRNPVSKLRWKNNKRRIHLTPLASPYTPYLTIHIYRCAPTHPTPTPTHILEESTFSYFPSSTQRLAWQHCWDPVSWQTSSHLYKGILPPLVTVTLSWSTYLPTELSGLQRKARCLIWSIPLLYNVSFLLRRKHITVCCTGLHFLSLYACLRVYLPLPMYTCMIVCIALTQACVHDFI